MLEEIAIVSNIKGGVASIVTKNQLSCSSCQISNSCGNGIIEKYLSGKVFISQIVNSLNAKVGDQVIITLPNSSVTKASVITYFIPILTMFLFVLIATMPFVQLMLHKLPIFDPKNEIAVIVFSVLGLIFGFLLTNYYNLKRLDHEQYQVTMVRIIPSSV